MIDILINLVGSQQGFVAARRVHPPVLQYDDLVSVDHRGYALGNDDFCCIRHALCQAVPDFGLCGSVNRAGGVIQNQHPGRLEDSSGNAEPLLLPA